MAIGSELGEAWTVPPGTYSVVAFPNAIDRSLRLQTSRNTETVRACRSITRVNDAILHVEADVLLDGPVQGPASIVSLRAAGTEIGAVVAMLSGTFGYADDGAALATDARIQTGGWYQLRLEVDLGSGRYDASIARRLPADILNETTGLSLSAPGAADEICLQAPPGPGDPSIYVDDLVVTT